MALSESQWAERAEWLLRELDPLFHHSDLFVYPVAYEPDIDTIYLEARPIPDCNWYKIAYQFGYHEGAKYDKQWGLYQLNGEPRVSYDGRNWIRYVYGFEDDSKVALYLWSQQNTHFQAEVQLAKL